MQKKTKTSSNQIAPIKAAKTQTSTTRKSTKKNTDSSCTWMKTNTSRPKTLILQVQRTTNGYSIKEATVLSPVNQHASRQIPVSVRAVTEDINRRGIIG